MMNLKPSIYRTSTNYLNFIFVISIGALFIGLNPTSGHAQKWLQDERPTNWREDAELNDIHFVDSKIGWAVGAQGTLVRTEDGGETWTTFSFVHRKSHFGEITLAEKLKKAANRKIQDFSTQPDQFCRFESVFFTNKNNGWAVGGYKIPLMNRTRGILYRTKNGGKSWHEVQGTFASAMTRIEMNQLPPNPVGHSPPATGWVISRTNPLFRQPILETSDSGTSWNASPSPLDSHILDASPIPGGFVFISPDGTLGRYTSERLQKTNVFSDSKNPRFRRVHMVNHEIGFAVGDKTTAMMTNTGGETWISLTDSPAFSRAFQGKTRPEIDLRTIEKQGNFVWLAGNPGNRILRYDLKTRSLKILTVPFFGQINAIEFVNERNGWIAGSLGTILATNDGGKSWRRQRGTQQRVSILMVSEDRSKIPLELLAKYSGEEGYLAACLYGDSDHQEPKFPELKFPLAAALERLGCVHSESVSRNELNASRIARSICTFRPNVVIINGGIPFTETALQSISLAMKFGSPTLQPWTPDRAAVQTSNGKFRISAQQVLPYSGKTVGDHVVLSRAMMSTPETPIDLWPPAPQFELKPISSAAVGPNTRLLEGLSATGQLPRRPKQRRTNANLSMIQLVSQKKETLEHLQRWTSSAGRRYQVWLREITRITNPLPQETAGLWLFELADQYLKNGKVGLAGDTIEFLARRYPEHAFAEQAKTWLIHFYSSSELAFLTRNDYAHTQVEQASANISLTVPKEVIEDGRKKIKWVRQSKEDLVNAEKTVGGQDVDPTAWLKSRSRKASSLIEQARSTNPVLSVDPSWKFSEAKLSEVHQPNFPLDNLYQQIATAKGSSVRLSNAAARESRLFKQLRPHRSYSTPKKLRVSNPLLFQNQTTPRWKGRRRNLEKSRVPWWLD